MYGLNHLRPLLSAAAAAVAYPKRSLRLNPPIRPFPLLTHFSRRPPTPAGIDDSLNVSKGDQIASEDENQIAGEEKIEYARKILPPELHSKNVVLLTCDSAAPGGICDIYLVGTRHFSEKSSQEVRDVIKFLQPQLGTAFLELCDSRSNFFVDDEFAVAYKEARKYGGKVIFGDRPIHITMKRLWVNTPLRHKTFLVPSILLYGILSCSTTFRKRLGEEVDDDVDVESRIRKLESKFPILVETFVHERDQYMSAKLLAIARKRNSVVVVVGKGHLAGIRKNWKQPVDMEELLRTPTLIVP